MRKTLCPVWEQDFRFEVVDDSLLQDQPLQFRVFDHDMFSADDVVGCVFVDLQPLTAQDGTTNEEIKGWFPLYDSLKGFCGELYLAVRLTMMVDVNPNEDSSAGVKLFNCVGPPFGHMLSGIFGFVEELIADDDPEYNIVDRFRTSRASNHERQLLISTLSGKVKRQLGRKVILLGGNAVLGYHQHIDIEGSSIVVRGYGTAVQISKAAEAQLPTPLRQPTVDKEEDELDRSRRDGVAPATAATLLALHRAKSNRRHGEVHTVDLITMQSFPPGVLRRIGGVVSARSVKLLSELHRGTKRQDVQELRDAWWNELRAQIKRHVLALSCDQAVGYTETTTIQDDLCVLSAYGTAAVLDLQRLAIDGLSNFTLDDLDDADDIGIVGSRTREEVRRAQRRRRRLTRVRSMPVPCDVCHVPYMKSRNPFSMGLAHCKVCQKKYVPEFILATVDLPSEVPVEAECCLLEARVCKPKKKGHGEINASLVSELLPFLEVDLHKQLVEKMKLKVMNAAFGLRLRLSIGENMVIALATATGVYLNPLPLPSVPTINMKNNSPTTLQTERLNKLLNDCQEINARRRQTLASTDDSCQPDESDDSSTSSDDSKEGNEEDTTQVDNSSTVPFIIEIDDELDIDAVLVLSDASLPANYTVVTLQNAPRQEYHSDVQMLTLVRKVHWNVGSNPNRQLSSLFMDLYLTLLFKLRQFDACTICALRTNLQLPGENSLQIVMTAMVVLVKDDIDEARMVSDTPSLLDPSPGGSLTPSGGVSPMYPSHKCSSQTSDRDDEQSSFGGRRPSMGSPSISVSIASATSASSPLPPLSLTASTAPSMRDKVQITPLAFVTGAIVQRYVGILNMCIVRETSTVREQARGLGASGVFANNFLTEAYAIARAHTCCMGGNALLSFKLTECTINENLGRNQVYSVIALSGDVALVEDTAQARAGHAKLSQLWCGSRSPKAATAPSAPST